MSGIYDRSTQDIGNLLALEHVNVRVPDQSLAHLFYVTGLGFTRDPYVDFGLTNMWINVGAQQLHLPKGEAQVLRGRIGITVPDLQQFRERLRRFSERMAKPLEGTAFAWVEEGTAIRVTCPYGNQYLVAATQAGRQPGIPWVELDVPPATATGIAHFYRELLQAPVRGRSGVTEVMIGKHQCLRFVETEQPVPAYDGHHIAIYLANFSGPYQRLQALGLVTMETSEQEYRFQAIVDPETGSKLTELEHEVRSLYHPMFGRELVNRDASQNFRHYRQGRDALPGSFHGGWD